MPRITKRAVDALAPTDRFEAFLWDDALPGFGVRALATGPKTFVLRYRVADGSQRRISLGRYGAVTVDQARRLAARFLAEVAAGRDPSAERRAARRAGDAAAEATVAAVGERFAAHQDGRARRGNLRAGSAAECRRSLRVEINPRFGTRRLADLTAADAQRLHDEISATRPVLANRVLSLLSQLWTWAETRGVVAGANPCKAVEKNAERRRDRVFTRDDLTKLGASLRELVAAGRVAPRVAALVRLLALTGMRPGEAKCLAWADVDLDRRALRLRDTKVGDRPVWLNAPAAAVLEGLDRDGEWVFPSPVDPARPVGEFRKPWRLLLATAGLAHCEAYVLRHTFASESEAAGHSVLMTGALLGHSTGRRSMTAQYIHHLPPEVRAASERVGDRIARALAGAVADVRRDEGAPRLRLRLAGLPRRVPEPRRVMGVAGAGARGAPPPAPPRRRRTPSPATAVPGASVPARPRRAPPALSEAVPR